MKNKITYIGNVKIKIKDKPPVRRNNNGTSMFFNVLRDVLTLSATPNRLPQYMAIVRGDTITNPEEFFESNKSYNNSYDKLVLSPLPINTRSKKQGTFNSFVNGACVLSALFPSSSAATVPDYAIPTNVFILLLDSTDNLNILAYSKTSYADIEAVFNQNNNNQAVIDWELTFSNKESN